MSSHAESGKTPEWCLALLDNIESVAISPEDLELFKRSEYEPVLMGSASPTDAYRKQWYKARKADQVLLWGAHFIAKDLTPGRTLYDWPSAHLQTLPATLNKIMSRRVAYLKTNYPLRAFFLADDVELFLPTSRGWSDRGIKVSASGSYALNDSYKKIKLKMGAKELVFEFPDKPTQVIFMGGGTDKQPHSFWGDEFTLAHEISHTEQFSSNRFKFFHEAISDTYAKIYTGKSPVHPRVALWRDPSVGRPLSSFFVGNHSIDYNQMGSIAAQGFWRVWDLLTERENLVEDFLSYMGRVQELLYNPASPWVDHNGKFIDYKNLDDVSKDDAYKLLNFFAAVSMQWSVERGLNIDLTEQIGLIWVDIGARGPYQRFRSVDVDPSGLRRQSYSESYHKDVNLPESWPTVEALRKFLR